MISTLLGGDPLLFFSYLLALVLAISIHEAAHAFAADLLGDPTARLSGRLTLDPRAHLDLLGTVLLLFTGFGWGKPCPFNPQNFEDPRRDSALVALAGPVSNLLFAALLSPFFRLAQPQFFLPLIILSINLAFFNLIPLDPLDGAKVVSGLLPPSLSSEWQKIRSFSLPLLFFIMLIPPGRPLLGQILSPLIQYAVSLFLGSGAIL